MEIAYDGSELRARRHHVSTGNTKGNTAHPRPDKRVTVLGIVVFGIDWPMYLVFAQSWQRIKHADEALHT